MFGDRYPKGMLNPKIWKLSCVTLLQNPKPFPMFLSFFLLFPFLSCFRYCSSKMKIPLNSSLISMSCTLTHGCMLWIGWMFSQVLWKFILTLSVLLLEVLTHFMVSRSWLKGSSYGGLKFLGNLVAFTMILFPMMVLFLMFLSFPWCCFFLWCGFWWIGPPPPFSLVFVMVLILMLVLSYYWSFSNVIHLVDDELETPPFLLCSLWSSSQSQYSS